MFCPKCRSEYREGFYKCPDCGVYLIGAPPDKPVHDFDRNEFVEVFSTYSQGDIAFLKSVLDGEGITYFFQGESSIMIIAAGAYARLMVAADEADRARELLRELGFLKKD